MASRNTVIPVLHTRRGRRKPRTDARNADAAKNLYVYLADLDVQKCRQIKTKVIIAIFKNTQQYFTQPDNFQSGCVFFYLLL